MFIKQRNRIFTLRAPNSLKFVYIWGKGVGVFANKNFVKNQTVLHFKADLVPAFKSSNEAVQVAENKFIDTKWLVPEAFINHSCAPNTKLDLFYFRYIATKNIKKNEEITYNYLTTEYDMEKRGDSFTCLCDSRNCIRLIKGFKYLTRSEQLKLKPYLSPFLLRKIKKD